MVTTACSAGDDGSGPAVPSPSGKAAAMCRELHGLLPEKVDGNERGGTGPKSRYTAVWGDPSIELRCGVPRPAKLTPGGPDYDPTSDAVEINGVSWLMEERDGGGYRFTTTDRAAYAELTVPEEYAPEVNALTDLSDAVTEALPKRSG